MIAERAKARQVEAGKEYGKSHSKLPQNFGEAKPEKHTKESNTEAAKTVGNTNAEYVRQAEKIQAEAPEVAAEVMAGSMNIPTIKSKWFRLTYCGIIPVFNYPDSGYLVGFQI